MSAAEIVAATEAGAVESASAAVVAGAAAETAVIAAASLVSQVEANAAEIIAETKSDIEENKEKISWQENRIASMESTLVAILETTRQQGEAIALLQALPLLPQEPEPVILQAESSGVGVVQPEAVEASPPPESRTPVEAKRRHRLL